MEKLVEAEGVGEWKFPRDEEISGHGLCLMAGSHHAYRPDPLRCVEVIRRGWTTIHPPDGAVAGKPNEDFRMGVLRRLEQQIVGNQLALPCTALRSAQNAGVPGC